MAMGMGPFDAYLATFKDDGNKALIRILGSQTLKLGRDAGSALLARHLSPDDAALRGKISIFLQTETGTALLACLFSLSCSKLSSEEGDLFQKLARELRVRAMADMGDLLADTFMDPLRNALAEVIRDIPSESAPTPTPPPAASRAPELPPASNARKIPPKQTREPVKKASRKRT